ncbi:ribonuclease H-like domain-containing protein [Rhizophagus irregularis DAOM 181602=DAOM 197198]|nr:ribonuclease H-like domain-containing protein [Rhizophagus irregularis DAOM 181602=DAOM 197198]
MQRVFRKSAKVQRIFLWETGNANGFSGNANGSEVEFESLNCLGISSIRYVVSEYLDKGSRVWNWIRAIKWEEMLINVSFFFSVSFGFQFGSTLQDSELKIGFGQLLEYWIRLSSHFSDTTFTFSDSSRKVIIRSSYGSLDNFIVRSLWALHWVNNPKAKELFEFLTDDAMEIALREDPVNIILTFDGWMNVKSEQLLGVVLMTSEGRPFVWKAADISSERETHLEVMEKTEAMIADLEKKIFAINYKPSLNQTRRKTEETPTISHKIFEIIDSTTFWTNINTIVEILYPYCKFLNILQQDKARLFQVIHSLAYLAQFWNNYEDTQLSAKILFQLEKKWNDWEQPLLLLSCLLHPEYPWSGKESTCILREFDDFCLEKYPFDNNTYKQFNSDIWRYWCYAKDSTNELGFVACRLFGICINAAFVERLWSCMGFLQSNWRNRLMLYVEMNNDENSNENSNENSHESPNENPNENSNDLEESDNEEIDLSHLTDLEKEFGNYLQGWAEMLEEETLKFQNEENEINEVNEITVSDVTHPAVDTNAKWDLNSLFKELELPF